MKKIFTLIIAASLCSFAFAQRMILAEEFTQASCPPCAIQNPYFNSLCDDNFDKVIGLHYQVDWPGNDPMNAENPSQVSTRVGYYPVVGATGVPFALMDGVAQTGPNYTGAPYNWTQSAIDAEYAVSSPFTLVASHTISADYDSIFITVTITAAQAFTATNALRAHIAVVEREILFSTAPGTNGETDFPWVMRRMLPTEQGINLGLSWTNGQTQTITLASPLPWYLRNVNQIGVVTFIQESNAAKKVHQAAYSAPLAPVPAVNDVSLVSANIPSASCNPVNPTVMIRNSGTATLTSAVIRYQFDVPSNWYYNLSDSYLWSGSLAPNGTAFINLPSVTLTGTGQHTMTANATMPNGAIDLNHNNSIKISSAFFAFQNYGSATSVAEGFELTAFPPANWLLYNPNNNATWTRYPAAGGFGNSTASAKMNFYNSTTGQVDELYLSSADLQWVSPGISLTFSVAYVQKTTQNDRLQVQVSTNCGLTWLTVYDKAGTTLSTHAPSSTLWVPTSADWRSDTVNLDSYAGNGNVLIKFRATSNAGNNLYLDDVNLQFVTGITQPEVSTEVDVYPNPSGGNINVNLDFDGSRNVIVSVYNSLGDVVAKKEIGSTSGGLYTMNLSALASGNYVVQVLTEQGIIQRKITINK
ncbi:MAG TPA: choice-of-anchor J domain-containing protein [Bacteroidia bacterium]|nr:choice-of-anchor J domain-containing protein [Bacteroidia bacterium]